MLTPRPDNYADNTPPDAVMVGKCWSCGTAVQCLRSACEYRKDHTGTAHLCAECPRKTGRKAQQRNLRGVLVEVDAICGARVMMTKKQEQA